jgi:hypothetical protein
MIKEHNRLIEEQDFFEKDSNSHFFWFQIQVFFHPQFVFIFVNINFFCKKNSNYVCFLVRLQDWKWLGFKIHFML